VQIPSAILDLVRRGEAEDLSSPNDEVPIFGRRAPSGDVFVEILVDHQTPAARVLQGDRYAVQTELDFVYDGNSAVEAIRAYRAAQRARSRR
jgi:hypothetical protein